jgi:hypothetical protein
MIFPNSTSRITVGVSHCVHPYMYLHVKKRLPLKSLKAMSSVLMVKPVGRRELTGNP